MHPMLTMAIKAARKASPIIMRATHDLDKLVIEKKQQNDFVSEVDRAAEEAIIRILREAYPDHAFYGEESGPSQADALKADNCWVIDPLDGTTNFLHGVPHFAISVALMQRGAVTLGVIYDPSRNELFTATKGAGAFLNDRRLRVSKARELSESLLGTGFPFRYPEHLDAYLKSFAALTMQASGIRRPGAATLDLAYVAAGRFDGFWEMGLSPWDIAAGALMVREAGGIVSDFAGEADFIAKGEVIAATPRIYAEFAKAVTGKQINLY
jgi:myo-inositol-1(or 4)-monophosphatase